MKIFLLFVFFFGSKTFGSEEKNIIDQLPEIERVSPLDTLKNVKNDLNRKDQKDVKNNFFVRKIAMSGMIFFGSMAFIIQKNADMNYNKYLKSGDRVEELDRLSGFLAIGSQMCIQIIIYTYLND